MIIPCIALKKLEPWLYSSTIVYGGVEILTESGEVCVADCLRVAVASLLEEELLVEVKYRGIHMGTFAKTMLLRQTNQVVDQFMETYAVLMGVVEEEIMPTRALNLLPQKI